MVDKTLRTLTTGAAISNGDLFISRQGADTEDKSVTGTQIKAFVLASPAITGTATITTAQAASSAGITFKTNGGSDNLHLANGGSPNATAYGGWNFDAVTADRIAGFGPSKTLTSLDTATYPTLTELSYVKGVSSAIQTQINTINSALNTVPFGDGSDGNLTISSGTTTLTRDTYYDTLTISGTATLRTAGFKLFAKTIDLSGAPAGAIDGRGSNSPDGGNGAATTTGGIIGSGPSTGTTGGQAQNGTVGGAGGTGAGVAATQPTNTTNSLGGGSGLSGSGGAGSGGAGGAGANGRAKNTIRLGTPRIDFLYTNVLYAFAQAAPGGGGGGGDGTAGAGGGGGGGPRQNGIIVCNTLITDGSTAAGAILFRGGNGGNGGTPAAGNRGGDGGGSGAGGAQLHLIYGTKIGAAVTDLVDCSGGNAGNGGNGSGTGSGGFSGASGDGGKILAYNAGTGVLTVVDGALGSARVANSGATGGTGPAGGSCKLTL